MGQFGAYGYLAIGGVVVGIVCLVLSIINERRRKSH